MATIEDFDKLDIRTGVINSVRDFPEAKKPAYRLTIDFGEPVGIKNSSVQLTDLYEKGDLLGKTILAVVNFPPRQIGPFVSEVLTLGVPDDNGSTVLIAPDRSVGPGKRLY
jgi:tRNA-binding protein